VLFRSAHSPVAGLWEIEVDNGRVVSFTFNGSAAASYAKTAESFTMDSIYKRAADSLGVKSEYVMKTFIEYDRNTGFIKSIKRVSQAPYKKRVMRDAGYLIEIIELVPLKYTEEAYEANKIYRGIILCSADRRGCSPCNAAAS
jgi:hypothetical protein